MKAATPTDDAHLAALSGGGQLTVTVESEDRSTRYQGIVPLTGGRLLIPRIARCLRAVPLPEGVLGLNHNLQVASPADDISIGLLREIITCEESQAWIRSNAPRLEGGFFSITTMLLRRMPIPERSGRNWKRRPERLRTLSFPVSP